MKSEPVAQTLIAGQPAILSNDLQNTLKIKSVQNKLLILLGIHLFSALMYVIRQLSLTESYSAVPDVYHPNTSSNELALHIIAVSAGIVYLVIYVVFVAKYLHNGIFIFASITFFAPIISTSSLIVNVLTPRFFKNGYAEIPSYRLVFFVSLALLSIVLQIFIVKLSFQLVKLVRTYKSYSLTGLAKI